METLVWLVAVALFPPLGLAAIFHVAAGAIGLVIVALFLLGLGKFVVWGMSGRRW